MNSFFIVALLSISLSGIAQFSYFNNLYEPPDYENNNSSAVWNLFVADTNLWCIGAAFVDSTFGHLMLNIDDETGFVLSENFIPYYGFEPLYTWGDTYTLSENENFIGTHPISFSVTDSAASFTFELSTNGNINWQIIDTQLDNDSVSLNPTVIRRLANGQLLECGPIYHIYTDFDAGILLTRLENDGFNSLSVEIPVWNEAWQDSIEHSTVFPTDMIELENFSILISGVWSAEPPFRRIPFFIKLDENLQPLAHFQFGNPVIDNWYPWMHERDDGKVVFAYSHGLLDDEITTYPIRDMRMGLFDPGIMDTLWVKTYLHQTLGQTLQDFEPTPDGGYIMVSYGANVDEELLEVYLLKVDNNFEEEWFQTYSAPVYTWDLTMHDLEVTEDGGYAILGQIFDNENEYYKMWLLKVDACGDEVWSGCPFVGVVEPVSSQYSGLKAWPNPVTQFLNIELPLECKSIIIRNSLGKICYKEQIFSSTSKLNLDKLAPGIYLLEAQMADGKILASKIVKE